MKKKESRLLTARSLILTPVLAFSLCMALTVGATYFASESAQSENEGRFDRAIANLSDTLRTRMTIYTNAIRYTRNLLNVKPNLSEAEFTAFVAQMNLLRDYPGISTIGYSRRLPVAEAKNLVRMLGVSPEQALISDARPTADIIQFVERINSSGSIRGYDLSSSPLRLDAMNQARDSGEIVATDRVSPVYDPRAEISAFLVFAPLYRMGAPLTTVEERRRAHLGFVYGGFRAETLFGRVTEAARFRNGVFQVRIYDGPQVAGSRLLYAEGPEKIDTFLSREFQFDFANHVWTLSVSAPYEFSVPALRWLPAAVFTLGLIFSALIGLALRRSQAFARRLQDDILAREKVEDDLKESRIAAESANQAKSIFLANISHEIRTPLGVMIGFSEIALQQTDEAERRASLNTVIRNGRELTRIIGDVLDVSKIEAHTTTLELAPFNLHELIQDVVAIWRPQAQEKGLGFQVQISETVPQSINGDQTRIKQVLTNLFSNALKFTASGDIFFDVTYEARRLAFSVRDTGIGISDEQRKRLFMPFSQGDGSITRRFGGSGLGLALSRSIAQKMGGDLTLETSGTAGAHFIFWFEVDPLIMSRSKPEARTVVPSLAGKSILLVDDSPDNRALVSLMLKRANAVVDVAVDGNDGVEKALRGTFDLILMDIRMPNKDGYSAFKELRDQHHLDVPVIALTAHALREERDKALALGFSAYITKPVDRETLIRISSETLA